MWINSRRLLERLGELGNIGRSPAGVLSRTALTDADRAARDLVVSWFKDARLRVDVDAVGNIFGTWPGLPAGGAKQPVMVGSHLDTVVDAGIYDGSYGVLAGLEVVQTLAEAGARPEHPITVAAFSNEEGVRFTPDMLGSLVYAGGMPVEEALACVATDGTVFGDELKRIGYAGPMAPGSIRPLAFLELHVEQGPLLEHEELDIGVVDRLQGISWQLVTVQGQANHAGTTPMHLRRDAGLAAARVINYLHHMATASGGTTVATVGSVRVEPDVINVVPGRATFTVDVRDAEEGRIQAAEASLREVLAELEEELGVSWDVERLARYEPVRFDAGLAELLDQVAANRGLRFRRMISGAGHDAQMMARMAPSAMIFVPSQGGVSHSPEERSTPEHLEAGANVLLDAVSRLAGVISG